MTYASEGGHWYLPDGTPFYTIIGKNGRERNVTLRDARPVNAAPSYSAIAACAAAPALVNYFKNQVALAAAENPRRPEEGVQAYMDRILAYAREHAETARDLGTIIHGCIEKYLCKETFDRAYGDHVVNAIDTLGAWCGLEDLRPERSFYHPLGYGGKCDVHKRPAIEINSVHSGFVADFKTKDFTADNLPGVYENHSLQLAAYREGFNMPSARGAIIYVSTKTPGLTHLVEIEEAELVRGWEMFKALLAYWQFKNKYVPQELNILKGALNG
jgi:hypothetical protein